MFSHSSERAGATITDKHFAYSIEFAPMTGVVIFVHGRESDVEMKMVGVNFLYQVVDIRLTNLDTALSCIGSFEFINGEQLFYDSTEGGSADSNAADGHVVFAQE
jgi:hypothetical protein